MQVRREDLRTMLLISILAIAVLGSLVFNTGQVAAQEEQLNDQQITLAVQNNLRTDERVSAHLIDVTVEDGVVTLAGTVDHLLARDQAVKVAESVKGVRAVIDRLAVTPIARSDQQILTDVKKALVSDPATDSYEIDVKVNASIVTLTGTVESWAEKNLTEQIVKGVKGIGDVYNEITIAYPEARLDSEIAREIRRRFELNPAIPETLIQVSVQDGEVTLTGTVGSVMEKSQAANLAWVHGVKRVDDSGVVVDWRIQDQQRPRRAVIKTDAEIAQAVRVAFRNDPRVSNFHVNVQVESGTVTLSGKVENLSAKKAAAEDARHTIGVWRVKNYIAVRPTDTSTDVDIAEHVRQALDRDVLIDRYDITVKVFNHKVSLYGTVDSYYEKWRAEHVAARVAGVVDVQNSLKVNYEWPRQTDQELREDIENELFWDWLVDSNDITVTVKNGEATLTGTVETLAELDAAVKDAFEGGARTVQSYLEVTQSPGDRSGYYQRRYYY